MQDLYILLEALRKDLRVRDDLRDAVAVGDKGGHDLLEELVSLVQARDDPVKSATLCSLPFWFRYHFCFATAQYQSED